MSKPRLMLVHDQAPAAPDDSPELRRRMAAALAPFGFFDSVKAEMVDAYLEAPDGVDAVIADALEAAERGKLRLKPAAVIVAAVRRGEHLREEFVHRRQTAARGRTGWRAVYGAGHAAMSYVEDPDGRDPLPDGYDLVTRQPHEPGAWRDAMAEVERRAKRTQRQGDGA